MPKIIALLAIAPLATLVAGGSASGADPANWSCAKETRDGTALYACRDCGPPQPEADGLQICQVYDFRFGVEAHQTADQTELVIIVTPYFVQPASQATFLRPPDRLELRRSKSTTP